MEYWTIFVCKDLMVVDNDVELEIDTINLYSDSEDASDVGRPLHAAQLLISADRKSGNQILHLIAADKIF